MPTPEIRTNKHQSSTHRGRWVVIVLVAAIWYMGCVSLKMAKFLESFLPFEELVNKGIQPDAEDVIGNLGGMQVKISKYLVELFKHEGDPNPDDPSRAEAPPQRTFASKLESFIFRVQFPEKVVLSAEEVCADWARHTIFCVPRMYGSVIAGTSSPHTK